MSISEEESGSLPNSEGVQNSPDTDSLNVEQPFFLDKNQNIYDKYYCAITSKPVAPYSIDKYSKMEITYPFFEFIQNHGETSKLPKYPEPSDYSSLEEYLLECLYWGKNMIKYFSGVFLPVHPVAHLYQPKWTKISKAPFARLGKFKPSLDPLLPKNLKELRKKVISTDSDQEVDPEAEFQYQVQHREVVKYKHQLTQKQQWQSQLFPVEPYPLYYKSFEEYERAYINWSKLVNKQQEIPITHPIEMLEKARIDYVNINDVSLRSPTSSSETLSDMCVKKEDAMSRRSSPADNIFNKKNVIDLKWAQKGKLTLKFFPSFSYKISELYYEPEGQNYEVIGVKQEEFVSDFENYGYHQPTINSNRPIHPIRNITCSKRNECKDQICKLFAESFESQTQEETKNNIDDHILQRKSFRHNRYSLLDLPFSEDELHSIWDANIEKAFTPLLETKEFLKYYKFSCCCKDFEIRYYYIMHEMSLSKTNFATSLFEFLNEINNLKLLYIFAQTLTREYPLLTPPEAFDPLYQSIAQLYYFSNLLEYRQCGNIFTQKLLESCRKLSRTIAHELHKSPYLKDQLWNSILNDNSSNDMSKIFNMLILSPSVNVHKSLLISDFFKYSPLASTSKAGRLFLLNLLFNDNGLIGELFTNCSLVVLSAMTKKINPFLAWLIQGFFFHFIERYKRLKLRFVPEALLNFFIEAATINFEGFSRFLEPVAEIITSQEMVATFNRQTYRRQISAIAALVCSAVSQTCSATSLSTVLLFLKLEPCMAEAVKATEFIDFLADLIISPEKKVQSLAWKFIYDFMEFPVYFKQIMTTQKLIFAMHNLADTDDAVLSRKFIKLCIKGLESTSPDVVQSICLMMLNAIGKIACSLAMSHVKFKSNARTIKAVDDLMSLLQKLKNNPADSYFVNSMIVHINSNSEGMILLKQFDLI